MTAGPLRGFPVTFKEDAWTIDLRSATPAGRQAAQRARDALEFHGLPREAMRACRADNDDGYDLPGRAKMYVPKVGADPWRIIFRLTRSADGRPSLLAFAFGLGHPPEGRRLSVYAVAAKRLAAG